MNMMGNIKKTQLTLDSFITNGKLNKNVDAGNIKKIHSDQKHGCKINIMDDNGKGNLQVKPMPTYIEPSSKGTSSVKTCPFYKIIQDTTFIVDGFMYGEVAGISHYFLSHFHYDHYKGLRKTFRKPLYCSPVTANLVRLKIKIDDIYLRPLALNEKYVVKGVEVILIDANHCPGAVMFSFRLPTGKCILHVGDFRACRDMEKCEFLMKSSIDILYLDTTYLSPEYDFPNQDTILMHCERIAKEHMNENTFFLIGSYTVGKEKVFKRVASAVNSLIYADSTKTNILKCLDDPDINNRLSEDKNTARVHVVSMHLLQIPKLEEYRKSLKQCQSLVAFRPTGWEHKNSNVNNFVPRKSGNVLLYGIPYSEHSSYEELKRFVKFTQPKKIIQTVFDKTFKEREKKLFDWVHEDGKV